MTDKQSLIIRNLGKYKLLTRSQMARLGIEKYKSNLSKYCTPLIDSKIVGCLDAKQYGLGHIYYLTKKGAIQLHNMNDTPMEAINYFKSSLHLKPQNLHHRKYAIDAQIELQKSVERHKMDLVLYDRDIDTHNAKLSRKTLLNLPQNNFLEPDAIFKLQTPNGVKLYCLELENNTYAKRSFEKILKHIIALNNRIPSQKYEHPKAHRVLMIYTNPKIMATVQKRLANHLAKTSKRFLFKAYECIVPSFKIEKSSFVFDEDFDFFSDWQTADNVFTTML